MAARSLLFSPAMSPVTSPSSPHMPPPRLRARGGLGPAGGRSQLLSPNSYPSGYPASSTTTSPARPPRLCSCPCGVCVTLGTPRVP
eukprot:2583719-Pyramimonas_sp.AAC.2